MSLRRAVIFAPLCLVAGAIASYGVAWWIEYAQLARMSSSNPPHGGWRDLPELEWPLRSSSWPESWSEHPAPDRPSRGRVYTDFIGYESTFYSAKDSAQMWDVQEFASGWPLLCAARYNFNTQHVTAFPRVPSADERLWYGGWYAFDARGVRLSKPWNRSVRLPLRPLWTGLVVDSALHGSILSAGVLGVARVRRAVRRRSGLCVRCKYPVGASPVCTECGTPIHHRSLAIKSKTS